jgi:hypothetical protein
MLPAPLSSVIPPGGFHFPEPFNGGTVRIEGGSYEEVARRLLQFRIDNGIAPGNPLDEVYEYVCGKWPHFCRAASTEPPATRPSVLPFTHRVVHWLSQFVRAVPSSSSVTAQEAARRASICASCPNNRRVETGCASCLDNIERVSFVWLRGRERDQRLGGCTALGQHNGVAVHAAQWHDDPAAATLPAHCWRKP